MYYSRADRLGGRIQALSGLKVVKILGTYGCYRGYRVLSGFTVYAHTWLAQGKKYDLTLTLHAVSVFQFLFHPVQIYNKDKDTGL